MLTLNLFFLILLLPKYILVVLFNLIIILKEKLINIKNLKKFILPKNLSIAYILFVILIFYNNFLNYEFIIQNQYYIIFLSIIYYFNFTKKQFNAPKIFWFLSITFFFYIIFLIFFNNIVLSCVISNNGFFDFFSIVENELIIFNIEKYNCDNHYLQGLLEHQTNFKFKIFLFLLINSLSLITNSDNKKKLFLNIVLHLYINIIIFSLSSRGLGLIFIFNSLLIFLFLKKIKKIFYSKIIIFFFICLSSIFYFKSVDLLNIFYFKNLSQNQIHISRENLFQKIKLINYDKYKINENKYLSYKYTGVGVNIFESDRWSEYKNFCIIFYKKYFENSDNVKFEKFYHNFFFNEIARLGLPAFLLVTYLLSSILINFMTAFNSKNYEILLLSIIFITNFIYTSLFHAFLSANLRNLILLIIILFILNKYNERKITKISL